MYIFGGLLLFITQKRAPKRYFEPIKFALLILFTYPPVEAAQHQKSEN